MHPLQEQINPQHPLVLMAVRLDWARIEDIGRSLFRSHTGRPASAPRLMAGLLYLQQRFDLSNEDVVSMWVENPYWQVFCGESYLQIQPPVDPSSLTRWRQRLGAAGMAKLSEVLNAAADECTRLQTHRLKAVPVLRTEGMIQEGKPGQSTEGEGRDDEPGQPADGVIPWGKEPQPRRSGQVETLPLF